MECQFCHQGEGAEDICGQLRSVVNDQCFCVAHQRCMQYSSNLTQYRFDNFGGFDINDVEKEVKRGKQLNCSICKKKGATAGCSYTKCCKSYHYPCAAKSRDVLVRRLEKICSQDVDKTSTEFMFCIFCGIAHHDIVTGTMDLVNEVLDNYVASDGMDPSESEALSESDNSISLFHSLNVDSSPCFNEPDFGGFQLPMSAVDENAASINPTLPSSVIDENAADVSHAFVSSDEAFCRCPEIPPVSEDHTIGFISQVDSSVEKEHAFAISEVPPCIGLSQADNSQTNSRHDRLSLRSSQKRRKKRLLNNKTITAAKSTLDVLNVSLNPEDDVRMETATGCFTKTSDAITGRIDEAGDSFDFDSLPDLLADGPSMKSSRNPQNVLNSSSEKKPCKGVGTSTFSSTRSKKLTPGLSQTVMTSFFHAPAKNSESKLNKCKATEQFEVEREKLESHKRLKLSETPNELLENYLQVFDKSCETGADVYDRKSISSTSETDVQCQSLIPCIMELDLTPEMVSSNLPTTGRKLSQVNSTEKSTIIVLEDDADLLPDLDSNSSYNGLEEDKTERQYDLLAVKSSSPDFVELSSTFAFGQDGDNSIDQVSAMCIPVREESVDEKISEALLKYAICNLGVVEENIFSWQISGFKKYQILLAILHFSQCLRDQNEPELRNKFLNKGMYDAVQSSQAKDASSGKVFERLLEKIEENFFIAQSKYGRFVGQMYSCQDPEIQAAFIILSNANDSSNAVRSILPRKRRVYICDKNTKFTIPYILSDAQRKVICEQEYRNLKWWLENFVEYSTILVYPTDRILQNRNISSLTSRLRSHFRQQMVPGGNASVVFLQRSDPDLLNYHLFVCKTLAYMKEEHLTCNHDICVVFDVGCEVSMMKLADVIKPMLPDECLDECHMEIKAFAGANPNYSPISCLAIYISLQFLKPTVH